MATFQSIPSAFRDAAQGRADQALIVTPEGSHSFREVDGASDRVAAGLAGLGIAPGERVALYCINAPEFVSASETCEGRARLPVPASHGSKAEVVIR